MLSNARQNDQAIAVLVPAAAEFADLSPDPGAIAIQAQLARAYMLREAHERSLEIGEPVLLAAERADLVPILADALVTKGSALCGLGRVREGLAVIEAGERLAKANGLIPTALRGLNNRLATERWMNPRILLDTAREGVSVASRVGDRSWVHVLREKVCQGSWLTGDWDGLLEVCGAGLDENPEAGDRMPYLLQMVVVGAARGEPVAELLDDLETTAEAVTDPQTVWQSDDALAFVALADGRLADAGAIYREKVVQYEFAAPGWRYLAAWSAILLRDVPAAESDLAALDAIGGHLSLVDARRMVIRAALAGLAGDGPTATSWKTRPM